ncbi:MAG: L-threonylcarbamoyladenylate synthase [Firmicutes bacterium]|nr:L-threonylcarbamoyladenylate synthase [Bacillota bacterium]MDH7494356.1 L-threonylcarbamoyladenylate synthase [Bacillota bacterium]
MNGTEVVRLDPGRPDVGVIRRAAGIIRAGGLVAFPTETVYGLGANGLSASAVARIFAAKGRPQDNPLILHVATPEDARRVVAGIPPLAQRLMERFWPGPLTLVLPKRPEVPDEVTAGLPTVGVRMPDNTIALTLIAETGVPIAAPSANVSGRPSPTSAEHVVADLAGRIDMVLDGGSSTVGVESTVIDMTSSPPQVLRPGGVSVEELEETLGEVAVASADLVALDPGGAVPSPGMKYTHYAPKTPVVLVEGEPRAVVGRIILEAEACRAVGKRAGVMCSRETEGLYAGRADVVRAVGSRKDLASVAAALFSTLRSFDGDALDVVFAEGFDQAGLGFAIMNRLRRASGGRVVYARGQAGGAVNATQRCGDAAERGARSRGLEGQIHGGGAGGGAR